MTNASSSKMSIEDMIGHYQRSIERSQNDPNRILHCIGKLSRMNITVQHLTSTGIGRTVNALRKDDGEIGTAAKALISKWKQMVASQESDGGSEEVDGNVDGNADGDENDEEHQPQINYDYERENKVQTESIGNCERKSHKTHEYLPKSSTSNNNNHHHHHHHQHQQELQQQQQQQQPQSHHHHHHRDQNHRHAQGKTSDNHNVNRKFSSDDTDEHSMHSTHSKHKHKSHSRDDDGSGSRKREHENQENNGSKSSSKHSKTERHHHRSRHDDDQLNSDEISDKKHKHENKDKHSSKHSNHHKSHSSGNEKTDKTHNKHKRDRESDDLGVSPKKHKKDSSTNSTIASSSRSDDKKSSKSKYRHADDGFEIDNSMGTSFADALGMLQPMPTSSKSDKMSMTASSSKPMGKSFTVVGSSSSASSMSTATSSSSSSHSKSKSKHKSKASTSSTSGSLATLPPPLLLEKPILPPLEDIAKDLPPPSECIIPNDYKPSPINPMILECVFKGPKPQANIPMLSETAALCASTTSKNQRTKVYSGVKSGTLHTVPSLHELCIRFLQKNIDALEYTGGVPFEILKPVLERATPEQLEQFEHYNPYLMEDSDILWQQHCQRKFKAYKRQEMETWREMYERCKHEQEARLNSLTRNIKESQSVAMPVRQTKLAYVDSLVKPPRNVIKKQNQFGTHHKLTVTPAARVEALSSVSSNMARSGDARLKALAALRDTAQAQPSTNGALKPKKAPLMTKALQLMKGRFKR